MLKRAGIPHRVVRVGKETAEMLATEFPMASCPVCKSGISLPLFVDSRGDLIGDTVDLARWIRSHPKT